MVGKTGSWVITDGEHVQRLRRSARAAKQNSDDSDVRVFNFWYLCSDVRISDLP